MHCSSCYGMIFLKLRDRAVAVNHCYFQRSPWYRQLMSVPSRGHKRGQNEMPWLLPHPWQASRCLKEGEAPTRLGFASDWEWHMLTRSKRTGRWRAVVQKGMPDKLQDRQEHCIVQTGCPNEDLVLVGAPSNDLMSRRHPIFPVTASSGLKAQASWQQQISSMLWCDEKSQSAKWTIHIFQMISQISVYLMNAAKEHFALSAKQ